MYMYQTPIPPVDTSQYKGPLIDGEFIHVDPETKLLDITSQTAEEKGEDE